MKKLIAVLLAAVLCFSLNVPAFAASTTCKYANKEFLLSTGYCNASNVNVRSGPGTNYSSLGKAQKKDTYDEYQLLSGPSSTSWSHVHGKYIGWMYSEYYTAEYAARSFKEVL